MRVVVLRPTHGGAFRAHERCLEKLHRLPDWTSLSINGPCVDICRAVLAEDALKREPKADVVLWVDADMVFQPETAIDIAKSAFDLQCMVGVAYSQKKFGGQVQAWFPEECQEIKFFLSGMLYRVNAIGFGLVAHPLSWFEKIAERCQLPAQRVGDRTFRPWFSNDARWEVMHSDDYSFCRRAREAGLQIYCDTRHRVGHIGEHVYMIEDVGRELSLTNDFTIRGEETKKAAE